MLEGLKPVPLFYGWGRARPSSIVLQTALVDTPRTLTSHSNNLEREPRLSAHAQRYCRGN